MRIHESFNDYRVIRRLSCVHSRYLFFGSVLILLLLLLGCNKKPTAVIYAEPLIGEYPLLVNFDGLSSNDRDGWIASYSWNLEPGVSSSESILEHTFETSGEHEVILTVVDNKGKSDETSVNVAVLAPAKPPFAKLSGETGGSPAGTAVYRADLSGLNLIDIRIVSIKDNSTGSGASGDLTGFDLDAVALSRTLCQEAPCVQTVETLDIFSYEAGGTSFSPGQQDPPEDEKLFGTDETGNYVDDTTATLGSFDGDSSTSHPAGFVSLGRGGLIQFILNQTTAADELFLYLGEVGDNNEVYDGDIVVYGLPDEDYQPGESEEPSEQDLLALLVSVREAYERGDERIDIDGDGEMEYRREVSADGMLQIEEVDVDGDNVPELLWDYTGSTLLYRVDFNQDGIAEFRREVIPDPEVPQAFTVINTEDTSGDWIPDYRMTYSIDPGIDTVEVHHESDDDQDGQFTSLGRTTTHREAQSWSYEFHAGTEGVCGDEQKARVGEAFSKAFSQGWLCLSRIDMRLGYEFMLLMARSTFYIKCLPLPAGCGSMDTRYWPLPWYGELEPPIYLDPKAFTGECGTLEKVLFHELLHYLFGPHPYIEGFPNPGDRVSNCAETCFGNADSQTCAACAGKRNGYSACSDYLYKPCIGNVPTYCRCDGKVYSSAAACGSLCPVSLGCFAFQCRKLGPCR